MNMRLGLILFVIVFIISCRKDKLLSDSNAKVQFSTDTLFFDTVFTSVGSITERVLIYNPYDQPIEINQIWFKNGQSSNFKMNVDGIQGKSVENVRIESGDSIFVFIEVTVDPNGGNSPLVIEEQLLTEVNGNVQSIELVAWGQDAYFFSSTRFKFDEQVQLFTDKPIVFYGYSLIDTGTTLVIPCGARIHFHPNGGLIVGHEASLKIFGCVDDPVIIQGDRLEDYYKDKPGQWQQILLSATSRDNEIRNAIIKNGLIGVRVDSNTNSNPSLILENTQILNMGYYGLLGQTAYIEASNTVIANCGDYAVALAIGGKYRFNHCTFANYWNENPRSKPVLYLNNYFKINKTVYPRDLDVIIENSIIYGSLDSELERDFDKGALHDYLFDHVVLKLDTEEISMPNRFVEVIKNPTSPTVNDTLRDPLFIDRSKNTYELFEQSRAVNAGKISPITSDIKGNSRDGQPDLGAYEFIP